MIYDRPPLERRPFPQAPRRRRHRSQRIEESEDPQIERLVEDLEDCGNGHGLISQADLEDRQRGSLVLGKGQRKSRDGKTRDELFSRTDTRLGRRIEEGTHMRCEQTATGPYNR